MTVLILAPLSAFHQALEFRENDFKFDEHEESNDRWW